MFRAFHARPEPQTAAAPAPVADVAPAPAPVPAAPSAPGSEVVPAKRSEPRPEPTPDAPTPERLRLKARLHHQLLDELNLELVDSVPREDLRREIGALAARALKAEATSMPAAVFSQLIDELMDEVLGLGPLEPLLADPEIADILVNGVDRVFVERAGRLERSDTRFNDEPHLLRIIDKIVTGVGRRIDESQPWVDARLPDGSRVNAIVRPCAIDGPSLSIRKFARIPLKMDRLVERGALTAAAADFLQACVRGRLNLLISGGTGSGKTTLLNALSAYADPHHRIVTIEDAAELQLQQEHVVRLETRPANAEGTGLVTQRDLIINALRMRPDRIIVGEVRGTEAFDMLQAMNTGHDGSMTTIHANSARDALSRLEQMVAMKGGDMPLGVIRAQIASGLQIVMQTSRLADGTRRLLSISEVVGLDGGTVLMQDIFVFRRFGTGEDGAVQGRMMATGVRPRCMEALAAAGLAPADAAFAPECDA
ncbi:Putative conjugal transfer protein/MT3759 [Roseivivax jejudonensis]|uniref:Putative conjugal transfer protein/MT3759 n=1 Tax=Roseivivax jejudonensis TaxID=1529041 RepID=A0A1X6ZB25_9RHOB|nr:CpaF family protein [Roseivivax jejudonensis]SLN46419.1 Putative conjugal transfer protein/MT3759 [Roseivivax jejudonensis]